MPGSEPANPQRKQRRYQHEPPRVCLLRAFTITSDSFVVTMDASSSQPGGAGVAVGRGGTASNPGVIRRQAFRVPGSASLLIQDGPGDYEVAVIFTGSDYTITVEECTGGRAAGTSGTAPTTASASAPSSSSVTASQTRPASAPPTGSTLDRKPNALFDAGGPESGPLPLMPDGGCPKEFPVKRNGACYE